LLEEAGGLQKAKANNMGCCCCWASASPTDEWAAKITSRKKSKKEDKLFAGNLLEEKRPTAVAEIV
jgi:hypothetical protein